MAKSIRSKWKRKCRAVKRERYGQKELERLKKVVGNDPCNKPVDVDMEEVAQVATVVNKPTIQRKSRKSTLPATSTEGLDRAEMAMEINEKVRVFNPKTMKDQHGTYPVWMHPRKIRKQKKKVKRNLKKKSKS